MNELELTSNVFENIKHIDENGEEFWYARELQLALNYKEWRKFESVIKKAKVACENSGIAAFDCFVGADKSIISGKGKNL